MGGKLTYILEPPGLAVPEPNAVHWASWMETTGKPLRWKFPIGRRTVVGVRFSGIEQSLTAQGTPRVWQSAVFQDGDLLMLGNHPTLESMDKSLFGGKLREVALWHGGRWASLRLAWGYLRWRRRKAVCRLGGRWRWRNIRPGSQAKNETSRLQHMADLLHVRTGQSQMN